MAQPIVTMVRRLFGTDGLRGVANEFPVTADIALRLGQALAACLRDQGHPVPRVVVGKDTRVSGYMLETALTSGLVSHGAEALLVGPMPTAAVARLTRTLRATAGIVITGSHNPHDINGYKIFNANGDKSSPPFEARLEAILFDEVSLPPPPCSEGLGQASRVADATGRYIEHLKNAIGHRSLQGLKLVVDCAQGAAYQVAPAVFQELGAEVIPMGVEPDGANINDGCGAIQPEAAAELVRLHRAHFGIAFDGDADRAVFIGPDGTPVSGDRTIALCALDLHRRGALRGGKIVITRQSNLGLHERMRRESVGVIVTPVGDRHVTEAMREHGIGFGGENCGHLIFGDESTTGDGILTALHFLRAVGESGKPFEELIEELPEYPQETRNIRIGERPPLESLSRLQAVLAESGTIFGSAGRHLVRYSETEDKLRIMVEHRDAATAREWAARIEEAARADLKL